MNMLKVTSIVHALDNLESPSVYLKLAEHGSEAGAPSNLICRVEVALWTPRGN